MINRFELLRTLAYAGWEESIHSGQHGENYFCILDEDSQEILSVTLDDAGNYTVNCQGTVKHIASPWTQHRVRRAQDTRKGHPGHSGHPSSLPQRLHRRQQSMMLSGQRGEGLHPQKSHAAVQQWYRKCVPA